jgi:hypothetical protein
MKEMGKRKHAKKAKERKDLNTKEEAKRNQTRHQKRDSKVEENWERKRK